MFIIFAGSINVNELNILDTLFNKAQLIPFSIHLIEKNTAFEQLPTKEILLNNHIILINDESKTKSVFIKRLEDLYGKDFMSSFPIVAKIPKPSTFLKNKDAAETVWNELKLLRIHVNLKQVNFDNISDSELEQISELLKSGENNKVYKFNVNGRLIEIRPNIAAPTSDASFTFEEFAILYYASKVFNFNKVDIFSNSSLIGNS